MLHAALQAPRVAAPAAPQSVDAAAAAASAAEALSRLEDDGGDLSVPLWFKAEAFTAEEFDPDEYVRDLRRYVRPAAPPRARAPARRPTAPAVGGLTRAPPARRCRWKRCARSWTST